MGEPGAEGLYVASVPLPTRVVHCVIAGQLTPSSPKSLVSIVCAVGVPMAPGLNVNSSPFPSS